MFYESIQDIPSISEMLQMINDGKLTYSEVMDCIFRKTMSTHEPTFTLTIEIDDLNEELTILCEGPEWEQGTTIEEIVAYLSEVKTKDLEHNEIVKITINEAPKRLRNHELESLGKEIATFIEFLFSQFPVADTLDLTYLGTGQSSALPLFILYRVRSTSIKIFSGITIENIMAFSLLKSLALTNIVDGLVNLKEYILEISSFPLENIEIVRKRVNTLFMWLSKRNGCSLTIVTNLNFPNDMFFNSIILDIERISLQANIRTNTATNENFLTNLMEVKANHLPNYVYHISDVEMSFVKIHDTKYFEKLLSVCWNLEKITLIITEEFIDNIMTEGKSNEGGRTIIKDSFSYCSTLKNLKSFFIDFQIAIDKDDLLKKNFISFLFNAILSVLPNNIENLSLEKVTFLNEDNVKMINTKSNSIERISFAGCRDVPQNIFIKFPKLRQIYMIGEISLSIPDSVKIVLIKYPPEDLPVINTNDLANERNRNNISKYRDDNYYFTMFGRLFKTVMRNETEMQPFYIVFLDDVLQHSNYVKFMNIFPLSKY
ncbi:Hypothetical protein SRAE_2000493600 [Strongyloides ratti]|uniref:Uncharacterized protein n=1 Tax=Strongyloides ratti TaxID=34506 RepID=A0A090LKR9_STRRB|nr:Hypothetical protein SRAE_2000493600 [Strongyloides ratti]CEF70303.1 Hypothetical protein SRAE_2000493600 [Strongyloides ratti]